jgi:hypothetical protein
MWQAEHSQLEHGNCLVVWIQEFKVNCIEIYLIFVLRLYSSEIFKYNWAILKLDHLKFSLGQFYKRTRLLAKKYPKTEGKVSMNWMTIFFRLELELTWKIRIGIGIDSKNRNWNWNWFEKHELELEFIQKTGIEIARRKPELIV